MWLRLNSRFARSTAALVLTLLTAFAVVSLQGQTPPRGVVVEEVGKSSAGEKAGIKPGDVVLSWVRAAAPPANPVEARGEIGSPFELDEVEMEQGPRGEVRLLGTRDGASFSVLVAPGAWAITVRPNLVEPRLSAYQQGKDLIAAKQIDKGLAGWRELAAQANANDLELATWLFQRMGDTLATARRWDEAHADYRASIEAANGRGDPALVARMWDAAGRAFERQNDFPKALAPHREALQLRQQISHETLAVAASLNRLGLASLVRGELAAAEDYLKRALALREKLAPESLDVAASLNGLGNVARERGELVTAEESFGRSLAIREKLAPDSLEVAISLNNVGLVVERRGDLAAAAQLFRRALAISEKQAPDSLMVANILNNLGIVTKERDLAAGEVFYRRSLAISEKLAPGSLDVAGRLNNLGILAFDRGDLVAAEEFYRRSLAIKEKLAANSLSVALTLNNLGLVAKERGDLAAADEFYRRSLAIKEKLAADTLTVTLTLINLGEVAMIRGDQIAAEEFFKRSLAILEKVAPGSLTLAGALTALGQVAEAQAIWRGQRNFSGVRSPSRKGLRLRALVWPRV